ncbi:vitamin B6 photo-protection and homoeostasis-domain-containing protein [Jackrogersella minutella]|nr:vitamin B6 photo-protection and homoeostasis-domain-containing protein [Jackrogersella minutella]
MWDSDNEDHASNGDNHEGSRPLDTLRLTSAYDGSMACHYFDEEGAPVKRQSIFVRMADGLKDVFLPIGYPHSVTEDYKPYQIYDSLQAFSSTIAGLLSSRAVLQGFGVGNSESSPTAAVLLTVLQESTGRLATILFAHRCGPAIKVECKYYRFLADIVNDAALFLDIFAPALPTYPKIMAICGAGILRALCGVSGGAAKAELSAHFAKNGNLAELNAKDGSQETVISLFGMLVGSLFLQLVHSQEAVLAWMIVLVSIHLSTNYQAVRSVQLNTLNNSRFSIVLDNVMATGDVEDATCSEILTPSQVSEKECILTSQKDLSYHVNVQFATRLPRQGEISLRDLQKYNDRAYVIIRCKGAATIWMKKEHQHWQVNQAFVEAYSGEYWDASNPSWDGLQNNGWDTFTNMLEIGSPVRIVVTNENEENEKAYDDEE